MQGVALRAISIFGPSSPSGRAHGGNEAKEELRMMNGGAHLIVPNRSNRSRTSALAMWRPVLKSAVEPAHSNFSSIRSRAVPDRLTLGRGFRGIRGRMCSPGREVRSKVQNPKSKGRENIQYPTEICGPFEAWKHTGRMPVPLNCRLCSPGREVRSKVQNPKSKGRENLSNTQLRFVRSV